MIALTTFRWMVAVATGNARHRSAHGESGSTLVEMALSIGILLAFIFGVMETCLAAYTYHLLSETSREATRYAIVRGSTYTTNCSAPPNSATCVAQGGNNTGDIAQYVQSFGLDPTKMNVNSTWLNSDGTACGTTNSCKVPGNQVEVIITYNYPLNVPFVPHATWTMTSTSQMVISQ